MHHKLDTRTASSRVFLAALVIGVLLTTLPPASFAAPVSEADTSFVELEEVVVTATRTFSAGSAGTCPKPLAPLAG